MLLCFCLLCCCEMGMVARVNQMNWTDDWLVWFDCCLVLTIFLAVGPQVMWCCRWWWWRWYDIILVIKLQSHCFIATDTYTMMMMKAMTTANGPEWPDQTWLYSLHTPITIKCSRSSLLSKSVFSSLLKRNAFLKARKKYMTWCNLSFFWTFSSL